MVNANLSNQIFNEKRFQAFCEKYSLIFPESYTDFLKKYNDSELDSNIVDGTEDLGIYVRYFYGTTNELFSNIEDVYKTYLCRMPEKCIPIADADFGNNICISLKKENYGKIYFWDHETMDIEDEEKYRPEFKDMILLADSFEDFLAKIIPFHTEDSAEKEKSLFVKIKNIFKKACAD